MIHNSAEMKAVIGAAIYIGFYAIATHLLSLSFDPLLIVLVGIVVIFTVLYYLIMPFLKKIYGVKK